MSEIDKDFLAYLNASDLVKKNEKVQGEIIGIENDFYHVGLIGKAGIEGTLSKREVAKNTDFKIGDVVDLIVLRTPNSQQENGQYTLSQKRIFEEESWNKSDLKADQVVEAIVSDANRAGLIAEVDGISGFIPNSMIDNRYVRDTRSYVGRSIKAKVVEIDPTARRLILSRKDALNEEKELKQQKISNELHVGDIVTGKVVKITDFGAFVSIMDGVDGLVHISEVDQANTKKVEDKLSVGQEVTVKIIELDSAKNRVGLSIKQAQPSNWDEIDKKIKVGDNIDVKVSSVQQFGAFAEIEPGVDGLIRNNELKEKVNVGDTISVHVLEVNSAERRIALSTKN